MARKILFNSRGKIGIIGENGADERYLSPDVPGQVSWQAGPAFGDGRRLILLSSEEGKPWEGNVPSHLWVHDLETGSIEEVATRDRPAAYMPACAVLPGGERLVVNPVVDGEQRVMTMNLDGSGQEWVTQKGEGFTYGVSPDPGSERLAFHSTGSEGYRILTTAMDGSDRRLVAGAPGHLYFGPTWSPDGRWLLYLDCTPGTDPGHDWADVCLGRPDGSEHRVVTSGMRHWFGTSYGTPETRGSGSNVPRWSPVADTFVWTRALPGSRTAWPYRPDRPDTDHFNRDYVPEEARGGTELVLRDLEGNERVLTSPGEGVWDFRVAWSPEGDRIAFCRAEIGKASELWVMNADGSDQQRLTGGVDNLGADHPAWM